MILKGNLSSIGMTKGKIIPVKKDNVIIGKAYISDDGVVYYDIEDKYKSLFTHGIECSIEVKS